MINNVGRTAALRDADITLVGQMWSFCWPWNCLCCITCSKQKLSLNRCRWRVAATAIVSVYYRQLLKGQRGHNGFTMTATEDQRGKFSAFQNLHSSALKNSSLWVWEGVKYEEKCVWIQRASYNLRNIHLDTSNPKQMWSWQHSNSHVNRTLSTWHARLYLQIHICIMCSTSVTFVGSVIIC